VKITVIDPDRRTALQKPDPGFVPHVTIEPNTTCNIRCQRCYACDEPLVKPLDQVLAEIDLACQRRKLDSLTFLGGEPTLHPELPAMIAHAKGRGLTVQLLTNGVRLLEDDGEALMSSLIDAGLDRFLLHVDEGQGHVHDDVGAVRHRLASQLEARGCWFGLALTLYAGQEATLPGVMRDFARYRWFDGVLVTLAFDPSQCWDPEHRDAETPDMAAIHGAIASDLGIQPTAYLPSSLDDDEVCWLMYIYAIDAASGDCFALSPRFNRLYRRLHRSLKGREFFAEPPDPATMGATLDLLGGLELALSPGRLGELRRFRRGRRQDRRFQYIVLQQAPRHDPRAGKLQICWQCPDAVVRGDVLVPVCIAGRLRPYGDTAPVAPSEVVQAVLSHLNPA
jgi:hypothetical protein